MCFGKWFDLFLSYLLERYTNQIQNAYANGELAEHKVDKLYDMIVQLDVGDASKLAEEYSKAVSNNN